MIILEILGTIIALLSVIPILTFFILFIIFKKMTKKATKSTHLSADFSAIFFIFSVNSLIYMIFSQYYFSLTIIGYLILSIIVLSIYWRKDHEINIWRICRVVWRIGFVFVAVLYVILLPIAFIKLY